jgi:catechol 2,3-dioxygenase-like lactoylglutathione lyase family enzyme
MTPIKITELDHIVLNVADVERSLKFYVEHLGLSGERVDEFRAGKAGFPSVRINAGTIIDLFPRKEIAAASANVNMNHFCLVVGAESFAGTRSGARAALQLYFHDAPAFHVDDGKLEAVLFDPFTAARDALELGQHEARQGVIIRRLVEG